jgi:hypothetical protein
MNSGDSEGFVIGDHETSLDHSPQVERGGRGSLNVSRSMLSKTWNFRQITDQF